MSDVENSIITIPTSQYSHCWKKHCKLVLNKCKMVSKTQYLPLYNYKVVSIGFYSPLSLVLKLKVFFNNDWQIHKARSWVLLIITKEAWTKKLMKLRIKSYIFSILRQPLTKMLSWKRKKISWKNVNFCQKSPADGTLKPFETNSQHFFCLFYFEPCKSRECFWLITCTDVNWISTKSPLTKQMSQHKFNV